LFALVVILLMHHHGHGHAPSKGARIPTATGRELLSGCLPIYCNVTVTICFSLIILHAMSVRRSGRALAPFSYSTPPGISWAAPPVEIGRVRTFDDFVDVRRSRHCSDDRRNKCG